MVRGAIDKSSYALSVRDYNETTREITIKHYRIRKLDRGGVYISPKKTFSDLLQLVDHYHSECRHWLLNLRYILIMLFDGILLHLFV